MTSESSELCFSARRYAERGHGGQTSFCPSVKCVHCDKTKEPTADILTSHERSVNNCMNFDTNNILMVARMPSFTYNFGPVARRLKERSIRYISTRASAVRAIAETLSLIIVPKLIIDNELKTSALRYLQVHTFY